MTVDDFLLNSASQNYHHEAAADSQSGRFYSKMFSFILSVFDLLKEPQRLQAVYTVVHVSADRFGFTLIYP